MNLRAFLGGVAAVTPDMPIAEALRLYDDRVPSEPAPLYTADEAKVVSLLRQEKLIAALRDRHDAKDGR